MPPAHDPIPTRRIGPEGQRVGAVGLGCMGMSWAYASAGQDRHRCIATIHRALDAGVTLIDTADMYGPFTNEQLVGEALAGRRDRAVLATKVGLVVDDPQTFAMHRDGGPEHVRAAIDASLERLRTDRVDLYQLHRVDPDVPLAQTWTAMAEIAQAGKASALGLSEASVAELEIAHAIHPVASVQSELSLWTRDALDDVLPWCAEHGIAFIAFAPLGRGFLTGQITRDSFGDADFRSRNPRFSAEAMNANLGIVEHVRAVAARHGATPAQIALAWTLAQGDHVIPIPGTTRPERLQENAGAARVTLTDEDLAELDAAPPATGARY